VSRRCEMATDDVRERTMRRRRVLALLFVAAVIAIAIGSKAFRRSHVNEDSKNVETLSSDERFQRAMAAVDRGNVAAIESTAQKLLSEPGYREHAKLLQVAILVTSGRSEAALSDLAAMTPPESLRTPAQILTTRALYQMHRFVEARLVIQEVLEREPDNADARRWLASIYWDLGANAAAAAELRKVIRLEPRDYRPWHLLGVIEFDAEHYAESIDNFRNALKRDPPLERRADVVRRLAQSLAKARRYPEILELAADEKLTDATLLALSGEAHWSLGRPKQARASLDRAISLEPENRFALLLTAQIEMQAGDAQKAISPLQKHLRSDPHDFEARYRLAMCYRSERQLKRYKEEMHRAEESRALRKRLSELSDQAVIQPGNAEVRAEIAAVCRQLGKTKLAELYQRAAEAYRRYRSRNPRTPMRQEGDSLERR